MQAASCKHMWHLGRVQNRGLQRCSSRDIAAQTKRSSIATSPCLPLYQLSHGRAGWQTPNCTTLDRTIRHAEVEPYPRYLHTKKKFRSSRRLIQSSLTIFGDLIILSTNFCRSLAFACHVVEPSNEVTRTERIAKARLAIPAALVANSERSPRLASCAGGFVVSSSNLARPVSNWWA